MSKKQLPKGTSQLDYLWTTYGDFLISEEIQKDNLTDFIPTQGLVLDLINTVKDSAAGDIKISNGQLILTSTIGEELSRVDISELGIITVADFGSKIVTPTDISKGCPFQQGTKVYYVTLSNNKEFWAKADVLTAKNSSSILTVIEDDNIQSSLILDENQGNVLLSTENGLRASLPIKNLGKDIKFEFLTQNDYNSLLTKQSGTLYFIKDEPYFYFGETKIGTNSESIFKVVEELPEVGDDTKLYLVQKDKYSYIAYAYIYGIPVIVGGSPDVLYRFKGSVDSFGDLPINASQGDVYNVINPNGQNYAWTGEEWDALGEMIDLSPYYTKDEVDLLITRTSTDLEEKVIENKEKLELLNSSITTEGSILNIAQKVVDDNLSWEILN